jgi:ParB-like chromosome segregation protein Spo0J
MGTHWLKTKQVDPGWRARAIVGDEINPLAASISHEGQMEPILVTKNGKGYVLVAGARRLAACQQLGIDVMASVIKAVDTEQGVRMQLAENSQRADFDPLEAGEGLKHWKKEYERKHPELKHGGDRGNQHTGGKSRNPQLATPRFTLEAARVFDCSETKVREHLALADLTKKEKAPAIRASTRRERNVEVRKLIQLVRQKRKIERLEQNAAENRPEDVDADGIPKVVFKLGNNVEFFVSEAGQAGTFDVLLTDPPYGQGKSLIQHVSRGNIDTDFGAWDVLDVGWVRHLVNAMSESCNLLIFCPDVAIGDYKFALESLGFDWRCSIAWHKTNPGTVHRPTYIGSMEYICWATRGKYHFEPWPNAGALEAHNHIDGPICGGKERLNHPTQKPLWLLERLLQQHAHDDSRVLDPFAGVGSTAAACKKLCLANTSIEIDQDYGGQAVLRLQGM